MTALLDHEAWAKQREEWAQLKGTCGECRFVPYKAAARVMAAIKGGPELLEHDADFFNHREQYEECAHRAGYVKRCDKCATTPSMPWIREIPVDLLIAFDADETTAYAIDTMRCLLPTSHTMFQPLTGSNFQEVRQKKYDALKSELTPKGGFNLL